MILKFEYIACLILRFDKRINRLNLLILIMGFIELLGISLCSSHKESKFHPLRFPAMSLAMWLENNGLGFSLHPAGSNVSPVLILCSKQQCPVHSCHNRAVSVVSCSHPTLSPACPGPFPLLPC